MEEQAVILTSTFTRASGTAEVTTCVSGDLYPILSEIQNTDFEIHTNAPCSQSFSESKQQSYTVFFVVPPGGQQATFDVMLKQA